MGEVKVPKGAYYGAQTQCAVENFPISGIGFPPQLIHALGMVKSAAASANEQLGLLELRIAGAIRQAAQEVIDGKLDREFVVDIFQVIGCDATITRCGQGGSFELNTMMPIMSLRLLEAIEFSANAINLFSAKCVDGIVADRARCEEMVERSLAMVTALAPLIGYENAAKIAREALATGQTVRDVAHRGKLLTQEELDNTLDPWRMTEPGIPPKQK